MELNEDRITPLTKYHKRRWLAVGLAAAMWVALSIGSYVSQAQGRYVIYLVTPVRCLVPAVWVLLIFLPISVNDRVEGWRWFPLCWPLWLGILVSGGMFLLMRAAGLGSRCDHLVYGSGVVTMALIGVSWVLTRLGIGKRPPITAGGDG